MLTQAQARALAERGGEFRSITSVEATRLDEGREWTSGRGSRLQADQGDWLLTDGASEWTVTDAIFRRTYRQREDGRWEKSETVRAVRVDEAVDIETLEGVSHAAAGDWLVTHEVSGTWPVTDREFSARYTPAG